MTDGQGPEHFSYAGGSGPYLDVPYTQTTVGDVVQYRGGVSAWDFTTTDPRIGGHARFQFSIDGYGAVGPEWGTLTITNTNGAWTGPCTGASWASGDRTLLGCWLVGSGAYAGFSAYYTVSDTGSGGAGMDGVIFPGSPPKR